MPSNSPPPTGLESSVPATVWVFKGRVMEQGFPYWPVAEAEQHPGLIDRVQSQ